MSVYRTYICYINIRPCLVIRWLRRCTPNADPGFSPSSENYIPQAATKSSHAATKDLACLNWDSEKAMAPHSSTLAWRIPWTEEPGRLQSVRSLKVGHDWATTLSLFTFMHWRRKWQPTPVFLPGESQGRGSLMGCLLWSRTESDTTEAT